MSRTVRVGVGMTAQEITYLDSPEERRAQALAAVEAWRVAGNGFEIEVARIEEWARGQLVALGFKDRAAFNEIPHDESLGDRAGIYAAQVLRYLDLARKEIANNNAPDAARWALKIGELFVRIQATLEWETFALRGENINKCSAIGRAEIAKQKQHEAALWQNKIFATVERLLNAKGKTDSDIAGRTYTEAGQTMETVRKFVADRRKARQIK